MEVWWKAGLPPGGKANNPARDLELERLGRIEANYEKDKAMPALDDEALLDMFKKCYDLAHKYILPIRTRLPQSRDIAILAIATDKPEVTFVLQRDYNTYKTTGERNRNYRNQDILTFINNRTGERISISVSSVPNMDDEIPGDAIAPGNAELMLGPEKGSNYSPDVFTIRNCKTISGKYLDKDGLIPNNYAAYRGHDTGYGGSAGCFTVMTSDPSGGSFKSTIIPKLQGWGVKYNDIIPGRLVNKDNSVYGRMK